MNETTRKQKGSESRDLFKYLHKNLLNSRFFALDSDLELIEKNPIQFIVARLDFKLEGDIISFSEAIAYNQLVKMPEPYKIPIYIIEAKKPFTEKDVKNHRFNIYEYVNADWRPNPPRVEKRLISANLGWDELGTWEAQLRNDRKQSIGKLKNGA